MRKYCDECIWYDQCGDGFACQDFVPVADTTDEFIEDERQKFFEEWYEYIEQDDM